MAPPVHLAVFERDRSARCWDVWVETAPGVHTFGTRLEHARANVRDALGLWLDTEPARLEIREQIRLPRTAETAVAELVAAREHLGQARQRLTEATTRAARVLTDAGLPMRDTAELLDLSHQRVSQLAQENRPTPGRPA